MADKNDRLLDVWITETGTVYTGVPYAVVTDWLQQGRLLGEDKVRLAGKQNWHPIAKVPALVPYLPREEPLETAAAAEALGPVELGWNWKPPGEDEDEDVDMIPLIDISLVLLIFFMMTATVSSGLFTPVSPPEARFATGTLAADQYWIGVEPRLPANAKKNDPNVQPAIWYSLGKENEELAAPTTELADVLAAFVRETAKTQGEVKLRLRADRSLPVDVVTALMRQLQELSARLNRERPAAQGRLSLTILGEVAEPKG